MCLVEKTIVGYADLQPSGLIDHFYVHHAWQGRGIGGKLFSKLEEQAIEQGHVELCAHVSITAKPFFESRGFRVVKKQSVKLRGVEVSNFQMRRAM